MSPTAPACNLGSDPLTHVYTTSIVGAHSSSSKDRPTMLSLNRAAHVPSMRLRKAGDRAREGVSVRNAEERGRQGEGGRFGAKPDELLASTRWKSPRREWTHDTRDKMHKNEPTTMVQAPTFVLRKS
eukprot:411715-Amorphochlora_amoeboformis.AAC.3